MTDQWRVKRYYPTRVIVATDDVLSSTQPDVLLCLSGGEAALLRQLLQYADRRATYASEYETGYYLAPTNEEWDSIEAITANLKEKLMTSLCEELLAKLDAQNAILELSVEALQCICKANRDVTINNVVVVPEGDQWPDGAWDWSTANPAEVIVPPGDTEACKLAQAWYQAGFEICTERVIPALAYGFDTLIPALAGIVTLVTGGAGLPAAIGVYTVAEMVQEILELGWVQAEENVYNWLFANKEELICAVYFEIKDGGSLKDAWDTVWADVVDGDPSLSDGDELIVKWSFGRLAQALAEKAQSENSPWYQQAWEPDYCIACGSPPGEIDVYVPPCPDDWYINGAVCYLTRLCLNHGTSAQKRNVYLDPPDTGNYNRLDIEVVFTSSKPSGWEIGQYRTHYWDGATWQPMHVQKGIQTNQPVGQVNTWTDTIVIDEPGARNVNLAFNGQGGLYDAEPYPLQIHEVHAVFYQV